MTNEEKIAGKEEKTWKAQKETDASGDKDKLTGEYRRVEQERGLNFDPSAKAFAFAGVAVQPSQH